MAAEVVLPRQGWTMEVGSIVEWHKRDGDQVRAGEKLFTLQSDKATNEIEALDSGILRIPPDSPAPGVEVPIGTILAYIVQPGEPLPFATAPSGGPGAAAPPGPRQSPGGSAGTEPPSPTPTPARTAPAAPPTPARTATGQLGPTDGGPLTRDRLLSLYRSMLHIRRTEEALARLHQQGLVHGACHTYVGEEAIAAGVCAHLRTDDAVFSTHRGHGHALAKGATAREVAAELLGRDGGCSRGRGGSMHLFKPEVGLMGTSGIVGPSILLAAGAGYGFRIRGVDSVGVAFFGDGASNNGAFHEGINMATVWKLPVVFVCENNQYATEVAYSSVSRVLDVSAKAAGYGLPGVTVDGNDVIAVYEVAAEAVRRARAGEGPTLIECKTYRTRPHSEGMRDTGYRTQEEIDAWRARDPIAGFRAQVLASGEVDEAALAGIDAEVEATVADAVEFARNSPFPDPATVLENVYA
jgi:TPP-dependent pyruvate/acetoin dehydrogenase alpha subunit